MKRFIAAAAIALIAASACDDKPDMPTAPSADVAPAALASTASVAPELSGSQSTICLAFRELLRQTEIDAKAAPADGALAFKVKSFEKAARSACK